MTTRKRLLGYVAAAGLATVAGVGLAPAASASSTWQLCNSKVLRGSSPAVATWFCVTWVSSRNQAGFEVVRPTSFEVLNYTDKTIYVTREDIGIQDNTGNIVRYTDAANHTIGAHLGPTYAPSSSAYWITDVPDGPNPLADGQAFVNVWLAVSGQPYEAITVYDTP